MSSEVKGLDFERLTRANYQTWIEKVKDYVLALDDENAVTMWEDYVWMRPADAGADVKDPVDEKDWQEANNAQARKARRVHNQAFAYIRRHLSDEIFKTTLRIKTSVPALLRHIRRYWHDHSPIDRASLRTQLDGMKLGQYKDMEQYIVEFKNLVNECRDYKIGIVQNDEDALYQFESGLPSAWQTTKTIRLAQNLDLEKALTFYKNIAREDKTLPGAIGGSSKSGPDRAHPTTEVCRNFTGQVHAKELSIRSPR